MSVGDNKNKIKENLLMNRAFHLDDLRENK